VVDVAGVRFYYRDPVEAADVILRLERLAAGREGEAYAYVPPHHEDGVGLAVVYTDSVGLVAVAPCQPVAEVTGVCAVRVVEGNHAAEGVYNWRWGRQPSSMPLGPRRRRGR